MMRTCLVLVLALLSGMPGAVDSTVNGSSGSLEQTRELEQYLSRLPKIKLVLNKPISYDFLCDYFTLSAAGNLLQKERISGVYTAGLPAGKVKWNDVRIAQAKSMDEPFPAGAVQSYMESFTYNPTTADVFSDSLFSGFPPNEVKAKNLVWDLLGFEAFAASDLDKLELNVPRRFIRDQSISLPGAGTFTNRDVELTWMGVSRFNGSICALIRYEAFFNPLSISVPGFQAKGLSHYWGVLWVGLQTGQIEFGTLGENVGLEAAIAGQRNKDAISVFRKGTFRKRAG